MTTVDVVPTMAGHNGVVPSHSHALVTPIQGNTVDHDGFHLSSMVSSLEQTIGSLGYDPDNLTVGTDVCDHLYESVSKVTLIKIVFID